MTDDARGDAAPRSHRTGPAALVIGSLTVVSRVLGLVRDMLFAVSFFGPALDAFALAFTIPNLFRRLFGEGALASSLVPAFVEKIEHNDRQGAARLAARALGALLVILGGVTVLVCAVSLIVAFAAGTESKLGLVMGILAIVMPYVIMICGAAVLMAYLNATGHFASPALAPILLNVAMIAAAVMSGSVWWLAAAVLVGGILQYAVQLVPSMRRGMSALPRVDLADADLRAVGRRLVPAIAGLAAFQVNVLMDRLIAEVLIPGDGAVGSLFLGNRLMQLPLAIFALSIATSSLPEMSALAAKKDRAGLAAALQRSAGSIMFWTIPSVVGLALLAEPIVSLLFERGAFLRSPDALVRTSLAVLFYAPGIVAFGVAGLYARGFYAQGDPKAVVRASVWAVALNLVLNIALVLLFQRFALKPGVEAAACSGEAGLALASTASGIYYLALLASGMAAKEEKRATSGVLRGVVAIIVGLLAGWIANEVLSTNPVNLAWTWLWHASTLPAAVCVGSFAALAVAYICTVPAMWGTYLRTAASAALMGVAVNLVMSSLPIDGEGYAVVVQRALAPVILGAGGYWFVAGIVAAPEYARARATLSAVVGRGRIAPADDTEHTSNEP
jgi:putative peptidoglycan lipid II flippase